jgi:hypothetical protein
MTEAEAFPSEPITLINNWGHISTDMVSWKMLDYLRLQFAALDSASDQPGMCAMMERTTDAEGDPIIILRAPTPEELPTRRVLVADLESLTFGEPKWVEEEHNPHTA